MRFVSGYQEVRIAPERALQDQVVRGILDDDVDHDRRLHAFRHVANELRNLLSGSFAEPEFPLEDVLELSEDRRARYPGCGPGKGEREGLLRDAATEEGGSDQDVRVEDRG